MELNEIVVPRVGETVPNVTVPVACAPPFTAVGVKDIPVRLGGVIVSVALAAAPNAPALIEV